MKGEEAAAQRGICEIWAGGKALKGKMGETGVGFCLDCSFV